MNNKRGFYLQILNDGRSALRGETYSQCKFTNGTCSFPGKCLSTVPVFLTIHNKNKVLNDLYMIFWFVLPALEFLPDRWGGEGGSKRKCSDACGSNEKYVIGIDGSFEHTKQL